MRHVLLVGLACVMLVGAVACAAEEEAIEPKETIVLFNGKDLEGWTVFIRGKTDKPVFTVEGGLLKCAGRPAGYVRTNKAYKNYKFSRSPGTAVCWCT